MCSYLPYSPAITHLTKALTAGITALVFLFVGTDGVAQRVYWNWYFGNQAGVTFRSGMPEPLTDSRIHTEEGCATISDPGSGALLFYTDGQTVWNKMHLPMPNGTGLHGDASTSQSALAVQWPGASDVYCIFTPAPITATSASDKCMCLKYSIVDMRRDNGFGDVVVRDVLLAHDVTEHITAVPDCNEGGLWIIARKKDAASFISFHLKSDGINVKPVLSNIVGLPEIRDAGQMQASPNGRHIVITSPSGTTQLFQFARSTGALFNGINLFGTDNTGIHYGAAFSRSSRYLFIATATLLPTPGIFISRFDLEAGSSDAIIASRTVIGSFNGSANFTPLQLAPDGAIYIGRFGEKFLSSIPKPDDEFPSITEHAVTLFGECRSGLPQAMNWNLTTHIPFDISCNLPFAISEPAFTCANGCVQLSDKNQGNINAYSWDIPGGIPSSSRIPSPTVCFKTAGVYRATLTVSNQYGSDTTTVDITVSDPPDLELPDSVEVCRDVPYQLQAGAAEDYRWQPTTGLSNPNIANPYVTVSVPTVYTVIATNSTGCSDTATVLIKPAEMKAGGSVTVCPGAPATLSASGATAYVWSPALNMTDSTSPTPVVYPTESTTYYVRMTNGACTVIDSVRVNVETSFAVTIKAPPSVCEGDAVLLTAVGGGSTFEWLGEGVTPSSTNQTTVIVNKPTMVTVLAVSGNCRAVDSVFIDVLPRPAISLPAQLQICAGDTVQISVTSNAQTITWEPAPSLSTDTGSQVRAWPAETTTYTVTATGKGGCVVTDSVTVNVIGMTMISAGPVVHTCPGTPVRLNAVVPPGSTVRWTPEEGLDDPASATPIANPATTTLYKLEVFLNGCVGTDSTTVFVAPALVSVGNDMRICSGSAAQLLATGAVTYRWWPTDGLSDPTIPNPIASPRITTTYQVTGTDGYNCTGTDYITVYVIDTTSISIRIGTVTAEAGNNNIAIPILVNVDPVLLPMFADTLRASLVFPAAAYSPTHLDRGPSVFSFRNSDQIVRLIQDNIQIVNSQQRINTLYGTVLSGGITDAPITWEDIRWTGVTCPSTTGIPGRLLITGCSLQERALTFFATTTVTIQPRPINDRVDVYIEGGEPGLFEIRLIATDGSMVKRYTVTRELGENSAIVVPVSMHDVASGPYIVVVNSALHLATANILWVR